MAWSGNQNLISNAYKFALGMGKLKGLNYDNLKVYITDSNFFSTNYNRIKGVYWKDAYPDELRKDYNKIRLGDLEETYKFYETVNKKKILKGVSSMIISTDKTLNEALQDSFNKDTGETSEAYYEGMMKIPASAKIFSNQHNNSWITNDLDWAITATANSSTMNYFKNEYNLQNTYDKTEYQSYGLNLNKLEENVCRLSATSFILDSNNGNKEAMDYGAAGVLLTYEDEKLGFKGKNELPVAFYEFGKTLHSNYNFLQIDWHEDGVIKVV